MRWHGREADLVEPAVLEREMERYLDANRRGDVDNTGVFAGEAVALIHDVPPAGTILQRIVREAEELLARKAPSLTG
jgi:nitronate monooxygenase